MSEYRYFARVNGKMVEEMYMALPNDPMCDRFLADGLIEAGPAIGSPGQEWYKQKGEANEL